MVKTRSRSAALVLTLAGLPLLAQADSPVEQPPGVAAQTTEQVSPQQQTTFQEMGAEPMQKPAPAPMGRVARARFTSEVVAREPQDTITMLSNENMQIIFFTELHAAQGQTVFHVWERDGVEMARVAFDVAGSRWRVYSTKNLEPSWLGEWTVRVEDAGGRELDRSGFSYVSTPAATAVKQPGDAAHELPSVLPPVSESSAPQTQQPAANAR
jgi:hypothetical protein